MTLLRDLALVVLLLPATLTPGLSKSRVTVAVDQDSLWLVPSNIDPRPNALAIALNKLEDGYVEAALPVLKAFRGNSTVAPYVRLHQGQAELALGDADAAAASAEAVLKTEPKGYLREQALWLAANGAEANQDWKEATKALSHLTEESLVPADLARAHLRLGLAAQQSDKRDTAVQALTKVHDVFPTSAQAAEALSALLQLDPTFQPVTQARVPVALVRAQQLYDAGQFREARKTYEALGPFVGPQDRDLVNLRLAQCDAKLKQFPAALQQLQSYLTGGGTRLDEAEHTRLGVLRDMGRTDEYIRGVRAFVDRQPDPAFAHAALNDLGTHHVLANNDDKAAAAFTENYDRFPNGAFAARAAWKAGWYAFEHDNYAETIRLFESAAVVHRRSDYRSGWVYWAARAHERMGHRDQATAGYLQTIADYKHSYYGREADQVLEQLRAASRPAGAGPVVPISRLAPVTFDHGAPPSNAALVQMLLSAQLFADAVGELRRVQRLEANSPMIEATLGYAYYRKGDLRPGISAMKRAYPQYLADGGEALPRELRAVLFPVAHWELLQKYADLHNLDPYLVAALVAQESTFDAGVRSGANAWGLMQILPSTGKQYAQKLKIPRFTTASLTDPETNVRIGTAYFADKIKEFGGVAPALASYNAGESRVHKWLAERPGLDRDEFIDGIPYPETQGYVKKIIGTAEDYRLLYGPKKPGR
ncbi:MAG TPA: transglycosylase SLT domain-containing protein [Vicinamibacterales bacterium]|nr:transglycosylase SLT domain-containing protein [Vicinamibacterales bacterium]